ncbi:hypothetical protein HYQ46_012190 [Verticillium longisporum]|nr:hypothetical protein HYQ46_012190 [Verticillium longisporum]
MRVVSNPASLGIAIYLMKSRTERPRGHVSQRRMWVLSEASHRMGWPSRRQPPSMSACSITPALLSADKAALAIETKFAAAAMAAS